VLFKLLGLPFSVPAAGVRFVFNTLVETAEAELMDDGPVKEELLLLQMQLEEGEFEEDEFAEREAFLFQRLRDIRAYREQKYMDELAARGLVPREDDEDESGTTTRRVVIEADLGDDGGA
jgi:hypothetical protein